MNGDMVIVGASSNDDHGMDSGSVYFYDLDTHPSTNVQGITELQNNNPTTGATITLLDQNHTILAVGVIQGVDGRFSFSDLPLAPALTSLQVSITLNSNGQIFSANVTDLIPIPDGVTAVGTVILMPGD